MTLECDGEHTFFSGKRPFVVIISHKTQPFPY